MLGKEVKLGYQSRSLESYPPDIVARVIKDFPADALGAVHLGLEDLRSDRLARCALFLANGSVPKLQDAVALGKEDYRDLIMAAEYDSFHIQLRDFNRPFGSEIVPNPLEAEWRANQAQRAIQASPPHRHRWWRFWR